MIPELFSNLLMQERLECSIISLILLLGSSDRSHFPATTYRLTYMSTFFFSLRCHPLPPSSGLICCDLRETLFFRFRKQVHCNSESVYVLRITHAFKLTRPGAGSFQITQSFAFT